MHFESPKHRRADFVVYKGEFEAMMLNYTIVRLKAR